MTELPTSTSFSATAFRLASVGVAVGAILLSVPAWAMSVQQGQSVPMQEDNLIAISGTASYSSSPVVQCPELQDCTEVVRAIDAYPDVIVFPIMVAGSAVAIQRNLVNRLALENGIGSIAVIYPEIAEPYRSVFTQIIDGIEDKTKKRVANLAVNSNTNAAELNEFVRRQDTKVVIALGRQGMKAASALNGNIGVVVGGVLSAPESETRGVQVNSLSPDPALLFSRLKGMKPHVRRVFAVYDPRQNPWMMRLAKDAARNLGLELVTYEAQDLRSAMFAYQGIFSKADSDTDALWLPQDSTTVEENSVLPLVLQESWKINLPVFSSSFGHVRRGVLFSLYPNNVELGRHLANSALSYLSSGDNGSGMLPLREVLMAINLRTAQHLGIDTSRQQKFDMAFPEK